MLNFVDWVINTDWGTPLLILSVSLIVGLLMVAALVQWLDAWRELLQSEADKQPVVKTSAQIAKQHHWHWGWRTHHV